MSTVKVDLVTANFLPLPRIDGVGDMQSFIALTGQTEFTLTKFNNKSSVRVFVNKTEATWTWLNSTTVKVSSPSVSSNDKVYVYRVLSDKSFKVIDTVSEAEAKAGTATEVRDWTAQRVKQAATSTYPATLNGTEYVFKDGEWVAGDYTNKPPKNELGASTTDTMSQKIVTDAILALSNNGTISDMYRGAYGLTWDSLTDTYIRTGASGYTAIQSQMKRCVLNTDGTVNYFLDPTNSNFKADGTPSNLSGADGNVMVQIPAFYVKYTMDGTLRKQEVSLTADTGFTLHPAFIKGGVAVPFRYAPAYRGALIGGKLRSVSGVNPTMSRSIIQFRADSIANGVGWHLNDWHLYNAIRTLCTIEIGTLNMQDVLGTGNYTGAGYTRATGVSNAIGNGSSNTSIAGWMSYRGIEDYYASSWQFMDGINIQNYQVFVNGDYRTFESDVFTGDYVSTGVTVPPADTSYIKDMNFSINGFIPTTVGGSSTTYTGDAMWSATGNRIALVGGSAYSGWACGGFALLVFYGSARVDASIGAGVSF